MCSECVMVILMFATPFTCECLTVEDTCERCCASNDLNTQLECEDNDSCKACGADNFAYDSVNYESACRQCGLVASYEMCHVYDYVRPSTYFKHNYFTNTILSNAMNRGFKISRVQMVEMERRFKLCVHKFNNSYDLHKRKYMLNANFVLWKIAQSMNEDAGPYLRMPKKNTLAKLETLWVHVNPFS